MHFTEPYGVNLRADPPIFVDFLLTAQLTHETLPLQLPHGKAGQVRAVWAVKIWVGGLGLGGQGLVWAVKVKVWVWVWTSIGFDICVCVHMLSEVQAQAQRLAGSFLQSLNLGLGTGRSPKILQEASCSLWASSLGSPN